MWMADYTRDGSRTWSRDSLCGCDAFCLSANSRQLRGAKSLASLASIKGLAEIVGRVVRDLLRDASWQFPTSSGV